MKEKTSFSQLNFPAKINASSEEIQFIKTTDEELANMPFHDTRLNQNKHIAFAEKFTKINNPSSKTNKKSISFIFHTAFCGSTFLSKLLGETDEYFSIREPNILMDLANIIRVNPKLKDNQSLAILWAKKIILSFVPLTRKKAHLLIKPTNATNNIIDILLSSIQNSKAILLYTDLDSFIISILKKRESGKAFIRNLYNVLSLDNSPYASTDFRKVNCFTDLQIACLVWSVQMNVYQIIANKKYNQRIKFLHANTFLNSPKNGLEKISEFLGHPVSQTQIKALDQHGAFSRHAKFKEQEYNTRIRQKENQLIVTKYQSEIDDIHSWANSYLRPPKTPPSALHLNIN